MHPYFNRSESGTSPGVDATSANPRFTVLTGTSCNPVSAYGCGGASPCLGMIEQDQTFSELTCRTSPGSGSQGSFCDSEVNCVAGFLCWTDPDDSSTTTCEEPCFDDSDCLGGACDTSGPYRVTYGRFTLYRCF